MSIFAELAKDKSLTVATGDIALSNVLNNRWKAQDILVIQELDAFHGNELTRLGAEPAILTSFESPVVSRDFYDKLPHIAPIFKNRILFSGTFKTFQASSGFNYPLRFPSFNADDIKPITPWNGRKFLVMVNANKYWKEPAQIPKRLEAIEFFGKLNKLDLFGAGWDQLQNLPFSWQKRLRTVLRSIKPLPCGDKLSIISNYKFAICFENMAYPGYITEKIIDCFVAGVIPVYLGAPDARDFIPEEAFVDMRKFDSWESLDIHLNKLTSEEAIKMISAGREFLNSREGKPHNYERFAAFVMDILLNQEPHL